MPRSCQSGRALFIVMGTVDSTIAQRETSGGFNHIEELKMIMFGMMAFPSESALAVADLFGRLAPIPEFIKITGPYIRSNIETGIHTTTIYDVDEDRVDDGMAYLRQRYARFSEIAKVSATIEEWLGVDAALQVLNDTDSVTQALESVSFRI
nr:hypothetical protein [uncultured bacterium]